MSYFFPWNFSQSKRPINYRLRNETWPNRMYDYKTWAYGSCGYEGTQYIRNAGRTYLLNNQNPSNQPILHPSNLYCIHPTYNAFQISWRLRTSNAAWLVKNDVRQTLCVWTENWTLWMELNEWYFAIYSWSMLIQQTVNRFKLCSG